MSVTPEGFKDMMGAPLHTNDYVIISHPEYRLLQVGQIAGWTAKKVRVQMIVEHNNFETGRVRTIEPESRNFIKTTEQAVLMAKLKWGE